MKDIIRKYKALDSLRGIAALMVCSWHYYLINHPFNYLNINSKPWLLLNSGPESVLLFFVLSGFVLTIMLNQTTVFSYKSYIVRRCFRLYPAYYFALWLSMIIFIIIKPTPIANLSPWFNSYASSHVDINFFIQTFFLFVGIPNNLDNVTWSLTYEMLISIIFPLLYFTIIHYSKISWTKFICGLILVALYLIIARLVLNNGIKGVLYYSHFFILGILCCKYQEKLKSLANTWILFLGIILYFSRCLTFGYFGSINLYNEISTIGVIILIVNALYNKQFKLILENRLLQLYGKVSYSFYLIHLPIMYILMYSVYERSWLSLLSIKILAFLLSSLCSYFIFIFIESNFIKLSKLLI